jgi:hypothetical protein
MTSIREKNTRLAGRVALPLPILVESHDKNNKIQREVTHLESISKIGAGFYLTRSLEIGQLLFLTMPVEAALRFYDYDKEQYSIWGIVRYCHQTLKTASCVYRIGAAFIGQEPPASYRKNPLTIYQLGEIGENGLWQISQAVQTTPQRRQPRYSIPIEIYLAVYDSEKNMVAQEKTVTENISEGGAAVFSGLELNIGETVKVIKEHGGFSAEAIVRNRRVGQDNLPRLHLEFINTRFPLEGIN